MLEVIFTCLLISMIGNVIIGKAYMIEFDRREQLELSMERKLDRRIRDEKIIDYPIKEVM